MSEPKRAMVSIEVEVPLLVCKGCGTQAKATPLGVIVDSMKTELKYVAHNYGTPRGWRKINRDEFCHGCTASHDIAFEKFLADMKTKELP